MATPSRSQAVSTPKPYLTSTPNRPTASPRPGTAAASNRPFAYKSPAVKTPASLHLAHHLGISSHPSSTPHTSSAIHDELLALNSPAAALMASFGPTGLTPIGMSQEGLGISHDVPNVLVRDATTVKNQGSERLQNIKVVADLLKEKVAGRGVSRDCVERLAQLQSFATFWDDDNLTVAGNAVDLEIIFDSVDRDAVNDVVLKLNMLDGEEPRLQAGATQILKTDLVNTDVSHGLWKDPSNFAQNLQHLGQLDHVDSQVNCFSLIGGIYNAFRTIWDEEKKRMQWRNDRDHLCRGNAGQPHMDKAPKIGASLDYWVSRRSPQRPDVTKKAEIDEQVWTGWLSCESSAMSTSTSQNWLQEETLISDPSTDHVLDTDVDTLRPNWAEVTTTSGPALKQDVEMIDAAKPVSTSEQQLHVQFICSLDEAILLPINVLPQLNIELAMIDINQGNAVTYQQALQNFRRSLQKDKSSLQMETRWLRSMDTFDRSGKHKTKTHSYALYSAAAGGVLWFYPVKKLKFTHPRQMTAALPILRQYTLLWCLLRGLIVSSPPSGTTSNATATSKPPTKSSTITRRSNRPNKTSTLDGILAGKLSLASNDGLRVDFTLDVISDLASAKLNILVPLANISITDKGSSFIHVSIAIGRGGTIVVESITGIPSLDQDKLRAKVVRMLTTTEDLGLVVEWLLEQAKSSN